MKSVWRRSTVGVSDCCPCLRRRSALETVSIPWIRCGSSWKRRILKREDVKERVVQYAGDHAHSADRVYVWGFTATGALGIRSYLRPEAKRQRLLKYQLRPALMAFWDKYKIKVEEAVCGYGFTVFVTKKDGRQRVYGTGVNTDSQISYHEMPRNSGRILDYVIEPVPIDLPLKTPGTTRVQHVSCGRAHTLILTDKEGVFSLGNNAYGQCGRPVVDGEQYRGNPLIHRIRDLPEDITQIICGQDHSMFLTKLGELYSCGFGADGQTGVGDYENVTTPTKVRGDIEGETITQLSCSGDCVLALSDKGDIFGWGNSEYDQLSMVTKDTQVAVARHLPIRNCGEIVMVAAGGAVCGILNENGEVFVWGYGILGKGPNLESCTQPSRIPETLFGRNELQTDARVTKLRAGLSHFAAITNTGDLYTWGKNRGGNLGFGHHKDQFFPLKVSVPAEVRDVSCGVDHMVAYCRTFS